MRCLYPIPHAPRHTVSPLLLHDKDTSMHEQSRSPSCSTPSSPRRMSAPMIIVYSKSTKNEPLSFCFKTGCGPEAHPRRSRPSLTHWMATGGDGGMGVPTSPMVSPEHHAAPRISNSNFGKSVNTHRFFNALYTIDNSFRASAMLALPPPRRRFTRSWNENRYGLYLFAINPH